MSSSARSLLVVMCALACCLTWASTSSTPVAQVPNKKAPSPFDMPITKPGEAVVVANDAAQRPPAPTMTPPPVQSSSAAASASSIPPSSSSSSSSSSSTGSLAAGHLTADLFNTESSIPRDATTHPDMEAELEQDAKEFLNNPRNALRLQLEQQQAMEQLKQAQAESAEQPIFQDDDRERKRARRDGLRHVVLEGVKRTINRQKKVARDVAVQYDAFSASTSKEVFVNINYTLIHTTRLDGQPLTGYLAVISNPLNHFGILPAPGSRRASSSYTCTLHKTSETAETDGCLFATNAGFFNMETGACLGNVVHDSQVLQKGNNLGRANFGIDRSGRYITGYLTDADVDSLGFVELITGRGWLIRNGASVLEQSIPKENIDHRFVTIKAPRTGVGYDQLGRLLILSVDGEEDVDAGADMYDFTQSFLNVGAVNAVNLDGGGSGTVFYRGHVVSKPTCDDTPRICERPVTTILCVY